MHICADMRQGMNVLPHDLPYRAALGLEKALLEIEQGAGIRYDANAAAACLRLFRENGYAIPA